MFQILSPFKRGASVKRLGEGRGVADKVGFIMGQPWGKMLPWPHAQPPGAQPPAGIGANSTGVNNKQCGDVEKTQ